MSNPAAEQKIKQWQLYLSTKVPMGIRYQLGEPGKMDVHLKETLRMLEGRLQSVTGERVIGKILIGDNIIATPDFVDNLIKKYNLPTSYTSSPTPPPQSKPITPPTPTKEITEFQEPGVFNRQAALIIAFKKFLSAPNGLTPALYNGDVNSAIPDPAFIAAIQQLETAMDQALGRQVVRGRIWQGNKLNEKTSPNDINNAINIIVKLRQNRQKRGQVSWTEIDQTNLEDRPQATKLYKTQDDTAIETGTPEDSQQIGRSSNDVPPVSMAAMDDRIVLFATILTNK